MLRQTYIKIAFIAGLLLLPLLLIAPAPASEAAATEEITVTFTTPAYEITTDSHGFDHIEIENFGVGTLPGEPELPGKDYNVALPPDAVEESVNVTIVTAETIDLPGTYNLPPVAPMVPCGSGTGAVSQADPDIYQNDAYFPETTTAHVAQSQMRKWHFAQVRFTPAQYNPVTGQIRLTTAVEVKIVFARRLSRTAEDTLALADTVMDQRAAEILYNYAEARTWYETAQAADTALANTYVIVTTNYIVNHSTKLNDFVAHTAAKGFSVEVITEDHYGALSGQAPNGRAEKIRRWLANSYLAKQIEYVLLIGNPNPDDPSELDNVGDLPMKMMWPRRDVIEDGEPLDPYFQKAPSDYFYADLTGNWDLDGDHYFGEYYDDRGTGGVDFAQEVYVGRISVYSTGFPSHPDTATLDTILQKIIDYDNEGPHPDWRMKALLPMSFSDDKTDGAYLADAMKNNYLEPKGYATHTMYQQGPPYCDSSLSSDEPLVDGTVRNHWQSNQYGIVTWWAHGSETAAYLNCSSGILFSSPDTTALANYRPAFVFQASCTNGYPENKENLGYSLLKQGAIGTFSATRPSYYRVGTWSPHYHAADNAQLGYDVIKKIASEVKPAGQALYDVTSVANRASTTDWANLMGFNLYGDPATRISNGSVSGHVRYPTGQGVYHADVSVEGSPYAQTNFSGYYLVPNVLFGQRAIRISKHQHWFSPAETVRWVGNFAMDHDATAYAPAGVPLPFYEDFESGAFGSMWAAETTYEGRARIGTVSPHSGSYSLQLDDHTDDSWTSRAAAILALDLMGVDQAELSFWWREFGDENHAEDGVFISADSGLTWHPVFSFNDGPNTYTHTVIDLDAAADAAGLTFNHFFLVKFQFYDDDAIPSDGYAIDDVQAEALEPDVDVTPASFDVTLLQGETATHTLTIDNVGDAPLNYELVPDTGSIAWLTTDPVTGTVPAGGTHAVQLTFDGGAPGLTEPGVYTGLLELVSNDPDETVVHIPVQLRLEGANVALAPPADARTSRPGTTTAYTLHVTNTGTLADTFDLTLSGHAWTTNAPATVGPLAAGESAAIDVTVAVPADALAGATDTVAVTARSQTDPQRAATATLTTTAETVHEMAITPAAQTLTGKPGTTVTYTLHVRNTGNVVETCDVAASGHAWTTHTAGTVGPLAIDAAANVTVAVFVPTQVAAGTSDTVTIAISSQADPTAVTSVDLTTTAGMHTIFLPFIAE